MKSTPRNNGAVDGRKWAQNTRFVNKKKPRDTPGASQNLVTRKRQRENIGALHEIDRDEEEGRLVGKTEVWCGKRWLDIVETKEHRQAHQA